MYRVVLYYNDHYKTVFLPDTETKSLDILLPISETGWQSDYVIHFFALNGLWRVSRPTNMKWLVEEQEPLNRAISPGFNIAARGEHCQIGLYCATSSTSGTIMHKYYMQDVIRIGRSNCDIVLEDRFISDRQGVIKKTSSGYVYEDTSKNGTFYNHKLLIGKEVSLKVGDTLSWTCGCTLCFYEKYVAITNGSFLKEVHLDKLRAKVEYASAKATAPFVIMQRPPHFIPKLEKKNWQLESPPAKPEKANQPLIMTIGPSLTMSLPMLMGSFLAGNSAYASSGVIMMVTSSVLAVSWSLANHFYTKHQTQSKYNEQMDDYIRRLKNVEEEIKTGIDDAMSSMLRLFPSIDECCSLVEEKSDQIWEHTPAMENFLAVRLGLGMIRLPYEIVVPKLKMGEHPEGKEKTPYELQEQFNHLHHAPVTVRFSGRLPIGIVNSPKHPYFTQSIIIQLASLNSYLDLKIAFIGKPNSEGKWHWLRWLPHTMGGNGVSTHLIATDRASTQSVLNYLYEQLMMRVSNSEEGGTETTAPIPHYIVFCEDTTVLAAHPLFSNAIKYDFGFTVCALTDDTKDLPKECRYVINTAEGVLYDHGNSEKTEFNLESVGIDRLMHTAMQLARMRENERSETTILPTTVSFMESFGVRSVEQLAVWQSWNEQHTTEGIHSVLGLGAGNRPFVLDLSDKAHGPHGIVAGTTGSGKSVLLQTIVLSLAAQYHPTELQFILIDYKGGGAFARFKGLPHVVGLIDNLNGIRTINRALYSIRGEVTRRLAIFKKVGVDNINDYMRNFNASEDYPSLSHIIIIIDEFAELKDEMPDFMNELVSTARVGRSVGLHLILATQKPAGSVSGEIWSNSRFHICLRVQTREDSTEMLHRPDAAYIKGMGRGFVQVGNDELFEQIQSSWHGAPYDPDMLNENEKVHLLEKDGSFVPFAVKQKSDSASQSEELIKHIEEIALREKIPVRGQMWLDELKRIESFESIHLPQNQFPTNLLLPFGIADDVWNQRRLVAQVDIARVRCLAFLGKASTGKTTVLQAMVYGISHIYKPEEVQVCILAFGNPQLRSLINLPHVTDFVQGSEAYQQKQLVHRLNKECERRDKLFTAKNVAGFATYNKECIANGERVLPAVIIMVDRIGQWLAQFSDSEQEKLAETIKSAAGRGVYFVVTALERTEIPFMLRDTFQYIPLSQHSISDYSDILEKRISPETALPLETPGRGMMALGEQVYEFQTCLAFGEENDAQRSNRFVEYGKDLGVLTSEAALQTTHIPAWFDSHDLMAVCSKETLSTFELPIALSQPELEVVKTNLYDKSIVFIYGKPATGKSSLLRSLTNLIASQNGWAFVLARSSEWTDWSSDRENVVCALVEDDQSSWCNALSNELGRRVQMRKAHPAYTGSDMPAQTKREIAKIFTPLCIVLDDVDQWYGMLNASGKVFIGEECSSLLRQVIEKGNNYGIFVFAACSTGNSSTTLPSKEIQILKQRGSGIATGNTLADFDPWGANLPYDKQNETMKPGEGFLVESNRYQKILLPGDRR